MATKFYLVNNIPFYSPGVNQGSWNDATSTLTIILGTNKFGDSINNVSISEGVATSPFSVLLLRAISSKLQAQTISGNFNVILGINEGSADSDLFWNIHVYVTQGNTDIVRGTLINNYNETGNEWPISSTAKGLNTSLALNPVNVLSGDRIVVEIGYISRNIISGSGGSRGGILWYGTQSPIVLNDLPDLTLGATNTNVSAGTINFTQDILFELVDEQIAHQLIQLDEDPPAAHAQIAHQIIQVDEFTRPTARIAHIIIQVVDAKFTPPPLPGTNVSGIYFMNPQLRHDNYYDNVVKKIPDPTIRMPYIGE